MAKVHIQKVKKTVTFKRNNQVANCPICGKFYNKKNTKNT